MRTIIFIVACLLFTYGISYSQSDSTYITDNIFTLSYQIVKDKNYKVDEIRIVSVDSNSLSYQKSEYNPDTRLWEPVTHKLNFSDISSFGYKSGLSKAGIIGRGALIGFSAGFILGCITGKWELGAAHTNSNKEDDNKSFGNRLTMGLVLGAVFSLPAILISALIPASPYENLNISKYDARMKSEISKRLIKKGIKVNEQF